jgi:hypothetical protein
MTWLWHRDDGIRWGCCSGCVVSGLDSLTFTASLTEGLLERRVRVVIARIAGGVVGT